MSELERGVDVKGTIDVLLKEYPYKLIVDAEYFSASGNEPPKLKTMMKTDPQWWYKGDSESDQCGSPVNHFTLSEAVLAHNQLAYVLASCMAQEGAFKDVRKMTLDEMNGKKFNQMMITRFAIDFRRGFLSSEPFNNEMTIPKYNVRQSKSGLYIFLDMIFDFSDHKSYGTSSGVIKIGSEDYIGA